MNTVLGRFGLVALAAFSVFAVAAQADTVAAPKKVAPAPRYQVSKEITLEATVTNVVKVGGKGTLAGGHLVLNTPKGTLDGVLGPFALRGTRAMPVTAGEHVKVVGVMTTVRNMNVFLVRTVETGNHTYNIRNERGFPLLAGSPAEPSKATIITGGRR
jgi:DNA/RNA endonuclease YhcR with UshA esterase domain